MQLIDLSVDMFNGMPNHKAFPNPVILTYKTHEQRAKELGTGFSSYTNYICMMDHSGTHVDATIHFNPKRESLMLKIWRRPRKNPASLFKGEILCF